MPFTALWRWYPSLVQLLRNGLDGDQARFSKLANCRPKDLSSRIRGPLVHQFTVDPVLSRIQAPKHPHYSGAMPPTAFGSWYPPSVQLCRQSPARYEAGRHNLPNGRDQRAGRLGGELFPTLRVQNHYRRAASWFRWPFNRGPYMGGRRCIYPDAGPVRVLSLSALQGPTCAFVALNRSTLQPYRCRG
jgi:hypothetical protein